MYTENIFNFIRYLNHHIHLQVRFHPQNLHKKLHHFLVTYLPYRHCYLQVLHQNLQIDHYLLEKKKQN